MINESDWRVRYAQILRDLNHTCWMSLADRRTKQMKTLLTRMFKADSQVREIKNVRFSYPSSPLFESLEQSKGRGCEGPVVQKSWNSALSRIQLLYIHCVNKSFAFLAVLQNDFRTGMLSCFNPLSSSEAIRHVSYTFLASFKSLQIKWKFAFPERRFDLIGHNKRYLQMLSHRSELSILQARGVL